MLMRDITGCLVLGLSMAVKSVVPIPIRRDLDVTQEMMAASAGGIRRTRTKLASRGDSIHRSDEGEQS